MLQHQQTSRVSKAIIPLAGRGTRLAPLTSALPKALFPLVDEQGRVRPVVHFIAQEAAAAGVSQLALIVSPGQRELIEKYFQAAVAIEADQLPARIEYIQQDQPLGFGHAVAQARGFVADEPFLLMLGDHVHKAAAGTAPCAAQVADALARTGGCAMVGMHVVDEAELALVGAAAGEPIGQNVFRCTAFIEKPTLQQARQKLITPSLPQGQYLGHGGIYAFTSEIFDCLAQLEAAPGRNGELQLSDAQSLLLSRHRRDYYLLKLTGQVLDTGTPEKYAAALELFRT